jgi:short-subunit dehydrogenase
MAFALPPALTTVLTALGSITLLRLVYSIFSFLSTHFGPSHILKYRRENAWALVTGASDGIGKAFAEELLASGFNVIIHGRNEKKLQGVKADFDKKFANREVKILVMDAASPGEWMDEWDEKILNMTKGCKLTVLVNNVGGHGGVMPELAAIKDRSGGDLDRMAAVNLGFTAQITRVLLPTLIANGPAAVLNVGSAAGTAAGPYMVQYCAAKAYVVSPYSERPPVTLIIMITICLAHSSLLT